MNDIFLCFKNLENMDHVDSVNKTHFTNSLMDTLTNISIQSNLTFSNNDKEDYIVSFLSDPINKEFLSSEFIDQDLFYDMFSDELSKIFTEFFSIDFISKKELFINKTPIDIFTNFYYKFYLNVILKQKTIIEILYNLFSYLTSKDIETIEKLLDIKIDKEKPVSKKFKLNSNNYILSLDQFLKPKENLFKIIMETNLFEKHLQNTFILDENSENTSKFRLYDILIRNSNKYEIVSLFKHLFKFDENIDICINNVEVYAILNNFESKRYTDKD